MIFRQILTTILFHPLQFVWSNVFLLFILDDIHCALSHLIHIVFKFNQALARGIRLKEAFAIRLLRYFKAGYNHDFLIPVYVFSQLAQLCSNTDRLRMTAFLSPLLFFLSKTDLFLHLL